MKIGLFGNSVNMFYMLAKLIRKQHSDTQLVLDTLQTDPMHHPLWYDLDFELPYDILSSRSSYEKFLGKQREQAGWEMPDWVIGYEKAKLTSSIFSALSHFDMVRRLSGLFFKYKSKGAALALKEAIKNSVRLVGYDCVLTTAMGPFYTYLANVPSVMWPTGGDLTLLPFRIDETNSLIKARASFQRLGLLHTKFILTSSSSFYLKFLKMLDLDSKWRFWCLPIDAEIFKPTIVEINELLDSKLAEKIKGKLLLYMPTRLDYGMKGTDKVLKAFAQFCKRYNAFLVMHPWGHDSNKAQLLVNQLGIEDSVYFYPAVLSKQRLAKFYNLADVILDQFITFALLGGVDMEAMASGKPLITYANTKEHDFIVEEAPVFVAYTEEEIYNKMVEAADASLREEIGKNARKWITKYHGVNNVPTLLNFMKESMSE